MVDRTIYKYQEFKDFIVELVDLFDPHTYVEVGVGAGRVFNIVARKVKRAVAVDIRLRGILKGRHIEHYHMTSQEFAVQWNDPIDLLFIDADHHFLPAYIDFCLLSPYVREHTGLILMHDTYPVDETLLKTGCFDCWKVARKIRKEMGNEFEIVTLPGPRAGLSIIRKATTHGWMEKENETVD